MRQQHQQLIEMQQANCQRESLRQEAVRQQQLQQQRDEEFTIHNEDFPALPGSQPQALKPVGPGGNSNGSTESNSLGASNFGGVGHNSSSSGHMVMNPQTMGMGGLGMGININQSQQPGMNDRMRDISQDSATRQQGQLGIQGAVGSGQAGISIGTFSLSGPPGLSTAHMRAPPGVAVGGNMQQTSRTSNNPANLPPRSINSGILGGADGSLSLGSETSRPDYEAGVESGSKDAKYGLFGLLDVIKMSNKVSLHKLLSSKLTGIKFQSNLGFKHFSTRIRSYYSGA
jgi:hypothetical protein